MVNFNNSFDNGNNPQQPDYQLNFIDDALNGLQQDGAGAQMDDLGMSQEQDGQGADLVVGGDEYWNDIEGLLGIEGLPDFDPEKIADFDLPKGALGFVSDPLSAALASAQANAQDQASPNTDIPLQLTGITNGTIGSNLHAGKAEQEDPIQARNRMACQLFKDKLLLALCKKGSPELFYNNNPSSDDILDAAFHYINRFVRNSPYSKTGKPEVWGVCVDCSKVSSSGLWLVLSTFLDGYRSKPEEHAAATLAIAKCLDFFWIFVSPDFTDFEKNISSTSLTVFLELAAKQWTKKGALDSFIKESIDPQGLKLVGKKQALRKDNFRELLEVTNSDNPFESGSMYGSTVLRYIKWSEFIRLCSAMERNPSVIEVKERDPSFEVETFSTNSPYKLLKESGEVIAILERGEKGLSGQVDATIQDAVRGAKGPNIPEDMDKPITPEEFCRIWKKLHEQILQNPSKLKRLEKALKDIWISGDKRGILAFAETDQLSPIIKQIIREARRSRTNIPGSLFIGCLGLTTQESMQNQIFPGSSSLSQEEAEAVWDCFWELKLKEMEELYQDPKKRLEHGGSEGLPCLFFQSVKFPSHTHVFPWCIVRTKRRGIVGIIRQSEEGEEQAVLKRIFGSDDISDYQTTPKPLRAQDQLRIWKAVAKELEQGNEVVPLAMTIDGIGGAPVATVRRSVGETGFSEPSVPSGLGTRTAPVREDLLTALKADARKKPRRKKRRKKGDGTSKGAANDLKLHQEALPDWMQNLMLQQGGCFLEMAKEVMAKLVTKAQKQARLSGIEAETYQLPNLNSFDRLVVEPKHRKTYLLDGLRSYQKSSMDRFEMWRENGLCGLFADAPGLGKTRKGCEVILRMLIEQPDRPVVVIAPNLVKSQWETEFNSAVGASAVATAFRMLNSDQCEEARTLLSKLLGAQPDLVLDALKIPEMEYVDLLGAYEEISPKISTSMFRARHQPPLSPDGMEPSEWMQRFRNWLVHFSSNSGFAGQQMLYQIFYDVEPNDEDMERLVKFQEFYTRFPPNQSIFQVLNGHSGIGKAAARGGVIVTQPSHIMNADKDILHAINPSLVIADEAHDLLKGENSNAGMQAVFEELFKQWNCPKVALTATPLVNKTEDLVSLLTLFNPEKIEGIWVDHFHSAFSLLVDQFRIGLRKTRRGKVASLSQSVELDMIKNTLFQLLWFKQKVVQPLVDRETWEGLMADLSSSMDQIPPEKVDIKFRITPTQSQNTLYQGVCDTVGSFLKRSHLVASLMIHPRLVEQQGQAAQYIDLGMTSAECGELREQPASVVLSDQNLSEVRQTLHRTFGENNKTILNVKGKHVAKLIQHLATEQYGLKKGQVQVLSSSDPDLKLKLAKFDKVQSGEGKLLMIFQGREVVYNTVSGVEGLCKEIRRMNPDKLREFVQESALLEKLFYSEDEERTLTGTMENNERALIFVKHKMDTEILKAIAMKRYGLTDDRVPVVHSQVSNREQLVSRFKTLDGKGILFLLPKSGGAGLNFTDVSLNILCTLEWTHKDYEQCVGRIMRGIGQKFIGLIHCDMGDMTHLRKRVKMKKRQGDLFLDSSEITQENMGYFAKEILKAAQATMRANLEDTVIPNVTFSQIMETCANQRNLKVADLKNPYSQDRNINSARQLAIYLSHRLLDSSTMRKLATEFQTNPQEIDQVIVNYEAAMGQDPNFRIQLQQYQVKLLEEGPRSRWKHEFHQYLELAQQAFSDPDLWDEYLQRQAQVASTLLTAKDQAPGTQRIVRGGICNAGSTCFMASALQAIASVPELRACFNGQDDLRVVASGILSKIEQGQQVETSEIQGLRGLCYENEIAEGNRGFEDAGEFLGKLMERVGYTTKLTTTFSDVPEDQYRFQDESFNPDQDPEKYSSLHELISYANSMNISVTPQPGASMQALIDTFWAPERLEELHTVEEDMRKRTYIGATRTKTPDVDTLSDVLMIDVKQNGAGIVTPTEVEHVYPVGAQGPRYRLQGILRHQRFPVEHYYARVRLEDGSVVEANDASVTPVNGFDGFPGTSYLYVRERADEGAQSESADAVSSQPAAKANDAEMKDDAAPQPVQSGVSRKRPLEPVESKRPSKIARPERELIGSYYSRSRQQTKEFYMFPMPMDADVDPVVRALQIGYCLVKDQNKFSQVLSEMIRKKIDKKCSRDDAEKLIVQLLRLAIGKDEESCVAVLRQQQVILHEYHWKNDRGSELGFTGSLTPLFHTKRVIAFLRDGDNCYLMVPRIAQVKREVEQQETPVITAPVQSNLPSLDVAVPVVQNAALPPQSPRSQFLYWHLRKILHDMNLTLGNSMDNGDCFFDSVAQQLSILQNQTVTAKDVRLAVYQYLQELPAEDNWVKRKYTSPTDSYEDFVEKVQYTTEERLQSGSADVIWGDDVIAEIIARIYQVNVTTYVANFELQNNQALPDQNSDILVSDSGSRVEKIYTFEQEAECPGQENSGTISIALRSDGPNGHYYPAIPMSDDEMERIQQFGRISENLKLLTQDQVISFTGRPADVDFEDSFSGSDSFDPEDDYDGDSSSSSEE